MAKIIECVPNISEGRNHEVIEACVDTVRNTAGVTLLDYSSDASHNRSVITFMGSPEGVMNAATALAKKAAELIEKRAGLAAAGRQSQRHQKQRENRAD